MTTDLAVRSPEKEAVYGLELAEEIFTEERREAISNFLAIRPDDPAFVPFLAIAAQTGLNPMTGEIWLIPQRMKIKDAEGREEWVDRYRPAAGRDGFLKVARRHAEFLGTESDVVHAFDTFLVRMRRPDDPEGIVDVGGGRVLVHEYPSLSEARKLWNDEQALKPEGQRKPFDAVRYRGPVIGAWAVANWKGRKPTYYYGSIAEHGKTQEKNNQTVWSGSWGYTSTMMLKSVLSYVLRISSGISGVVPVDEVKEGDPERALAAEEWDPGAQLQAGLNPDLVTEFRESIEAAAEVDPSLWGRAKVELYAPSIENDADLEELIARVQAETDQERVRRAEPEVVDAEPVEEEPSGSSSNLSPEEIESLRHEEADLTGKLDELDEADEDFEGTRMRLEEVRAELADAEEAK